MIAIPERASNSARCSTAAESAASAALDIRIANQANEVAIVKPVAALSASRMKAVLMAPSLSTLRSAKRRLTLRLVRLLRQTRTPSVGGGSASAARRNECVHCPPTKWYLVTRPRRAEPRRPAAVRNRGIARTPSATAARVRGFLIELTKSSNEATRLAAIREILDRLLGKPAVFVDAVHTKVDVGALYLQALKRARVDGGNTSNGSNDEPGE